MSVPHRAPRWAPPAAIPTGLRRGRRRDPILRALDVAVEARVRWLVALHGGEVSDNRVDDYTTALVVSARSVVANDNDVLSLELRAPGGGVLEQWSPGAHLDLHLPSGRIRQYSLCGDPADRTRYRIAVRRIPGGGGGSIEVHDDLLEGTVVAIRGPRNAFGFVEPGRTSRAARIHFVAGGIGITPILPMVCAASRMGLDWSLTCVGRDRRTLPFLDEVEGLGSRAAVRTDDEHGRPGAEDLLPQSLRDGDVVYCCGPVAMMDLVSARVRDEPGVELHMERFSAAPVVDGRPFRIRLARSGRVVDVGADQTALDAVLGVERTAPYSCRQGFCGTCMVRVSEGEVDHRDNTLSAADRADGRMLLCVSRSESTSLTVDL